MKPSAAFPLPSKGRGQGVGTQFEEKGSCYPTPNPIPSKGMGKAAAKPAAGRGHPMEISTSSDAACCVVGCLLEREPMQRAVSPDACRSVKPTYISHGNHGKHRKINPFNPFNPWLNISHRNHGKHRKTNPFNPFNPWLISHTENTESTEKQSVQSVV